MEKYVDVLIEKLEAMKVSGAQPGVGEVMELVLVTAAELKLPFERRKSILQASLSLDGVTPEEAELLRDWEDANKA